jgi:hypothetical protein
MCLLCKKLNFLSGPNDSENSRSVRPFGEKIGDGLSVPNGTDRPGDGSLQKSRRRIVRGRIVRVPKIVMLPKPSPKRRE